MPDNIRNILVRVRLLKKIGERNDERKKTRTNSIQLSNM